MKSLEQYQPLCASIFDGAFGGIASGASSLIGNTIGGILQNNAIKKQNDMIREENALNRKFANEEATNSYLRQKHLMKMQMDYDSAVNQRKRLEEAGLNPAMMMDGGNAGSASSQSAPQASQPSSIPYQAQRYEWIQNMAQNAANIQLTLAQARKEDAGAKELGSRDQVNMANVDFIRSSKAYQDVMKDINDTWLPKIYKWDVEAKKAGVNLADAQASAEDVRRTLMRAQEQRIFTMTPLEVAKMNYDAVESWARTNKINVETQFGKAAFNLQLQRLSAESFSLFAAGNLSNSQASLNQQQFDFNEDTKFFRKSILKSQAGIFGNQKTLSDYDVELGRYLQPGRIINAKNDNFKAETESKYLQQWAEEYGSYMDSRLGVTHDPTTTRFWKSLTRKFIEVSPTFIPMAGSAFSPAPVQYHEHFRYGNTNTYINN